MTHSKNTISILEVFYKSSNTDPCGYLYLKSFPVQGKDGFQVRSGGLVEYARQKAMRKIDA